MQQKVQRLSQIEIDFLSELLKAPKRNGAFKKLTSVSISSFSHFKHQGRIQRKRVLRDGVMSKILEQLKDLLK